VHPFFIQAADLRLRYFQKLLNAEECRITAEMWEKLDMKDARSLYQSAVCRAVTANVVANWKSMGVERNQQIGDQADRAMGWLKQAVAAGFDDVDAIKTGSDFQALRDRADFMAMVTELETKHATPAK
jgi:hypothetical protein